MKDILFIIFLALWLLPAGGCATPGPYEPGVRPQTQPYTGMGVPPSFYNNDPALEHWFTPPYFNPYMGGN
jgi:hypothetical protein